MKSKVAYNLGQCRTESPHTIHQYEYKSQRGRFPLSRKVDRECEYVRTNRNQNSYSQYQAYGNPTGSQWQGCYYCCRRSMS